MTQSVASFELFWEYLNFSQIFKKYNVFLSISNVS